MKNWSRTNKIVVGFVVVPLLLIGSCVAALWVSDADVRERREAETMVHASVKPSAACSGLDVTLRNDSNLEMESADVTVTKKAPGFSDNRAPSEWSSKRWTKIVGPHKAESQCLEDPAVQGFDYAAKIESANFKVK